MSSTFRTQASLAIEQGKAREALQSLAALWREEAGPATAGFIIKSFEKLRGQVSLSTARVAILRSFTVEPIVPLLQAQLLVGGVDSAVFVGEFNSWTQEILDPHSALYEFTPGVVILAVATRDLAPELWPDAGAFVIGADEAVIARIRGVITAFRKNSQAAMIIHNLEVPDLPGAGILDAQTGNGQIAAIHKINAALVAMAAEFGGVYVLDYDGLVARHGRREWRDEKRWLTMRLPIRAKYLAAMATEWVRYLVPIAGRLAKVLAVDLDNTMWGGVIGEDGMAGIQLNGEYPGAAFQSMQRALLDLKRRGILLAIASKNNLDDAMEAIDHHAGMLVRSRDFAALRINWNEKASNLQEIAQELNLGLDSIAFLDDNPVERQQMHENAPEVMVLDWNGEPADLARVVREFAPFERLTLSEEDRNRSDYYTADRMRAQLETTSSSREDFYRSLEQVAELAPVNASTLARVAQLTQKTNQFNLTTRRYTDAQISEMSRNRAWNVLSIKVRDRYADNGLVGVAITQDRDGVCEIDTFLLSCRVIGRTVETALLAHLCEQARARGCHLVEGWFLPTKKNAPAKSFYTDHAFAVLETTEKGTRYGLDLTTSTLEGSPWIELRT